MQLLSYWGLYLPKCILQFYEWPPKSKSSWSCMQFLGKPRSVIFPAMQCIKGNLFLLLSLIIQETFPTKPVGLVCPRLASPSCPAVKHYTTGGGGQSSSNKVLRRVLFIKKRVDIMRICIQIKFPKLWEIICAFFPKFLACDSQATYGNPKGQIILKCLFGLFNFLQKTNKNKSTLGFILQSNLALRNCLIRNKLVHIKEPFPVTNLPFTS